MFSTNIVIDDDQIPSENLFDFCEVRHTSTGQFAWDASRIKIRHVRGQGDEFDRRDVSYDQVKAEIAQMKGMKPLSANFAAFLLANPEEYPPSWEGKMICFFGTEFLTPAGHVGVIVLNKQKDGPVMLNVLYAPSTLSHNFLVAMRQAS